MLQPDDGLPVGIDIDMAEVTNKEGGVVISAASLVTDVCGTYNLLLEAAKKFSTIYDVVYNEVVRSHAQMRGESLEGKEHLF